MAPRPTVPDEVVALIKAIVNVDRRERHAAGFKLGSNFLAHRIAEALGLKLEFVRKIKERKRRRNVKAARIMQRTYTVAPERLEEIRQRRIRSGDVAASWRGASIYKQYGAGSFRQLIDEASAEPGEPGKRSRPRRRSRSPKQT